MKLARQMFITGYVVELVEYRNTEYRYAYAC